MAEENQAPEVGEKKDLEEEEEHQALIPPEEARRGLEGIVHPVVAAEAAMAARQLLERLISEHMTPGKDFAVIPGTDKPSLLKPGAEKACIWFALTPTFPEPLQRRVEDYTAGLFHYSYTCQLLDRRTGQLVAECEGSANSREKRFAKYRDGADRNPFDQINPLQKMGQKRAFVGAVLFGCGLSEHFTQDVEDMNPEDLAPAGHPSDEPFRLTDQIQFGKHRGKSWEEICRDDPEYAFWACGRKEGDEGLKKLSQGAKTIISRELDRLAEVKVKDAQDVEEGSTQDPEDAGLRITEVLRDRLVPGGKHKDKTWLEVAERAPGYLKAVLERPWGQKFAPQGSELRRVILHVVQYGLPQIQQPYSYLFGQEMEKARVSQEDLAIVARAHRDLPDDPESWKEADYQLALRDFQKHGAPRLIEGAKAKLAQKAQVETKKKEDPLPAREKKRRIPRKLEEEASRVLARAEKTGLPNVDQWELGLTGFKEMDDLEEFTKFLDELKQAYFAYLATKKGEEAKLEGLKEGLDLFTPGKEENDELGGEA